MLRMACAVAELTARRCPIGGFLEVGTTEMSPFGAGLT